MFQGIVPHKQQKSADDDDESTLRILAPFKTHRQNDPRSERNGSSALQSRTESDKKLLIIFYLGH